jgi:hypothetical protein
LLGALRPAHKINPSRLLSSSVVQRDSEDIGAPVEG